MNNLVLCLSGIFSCAGFVFQIFAKHRQAAVFYRTKYSLKGDGGSIYWDIRFLIFNGVAFLMLSLATLSVLALFFNQAFGYSGVAVLILIVSQIAQNAYKLRMH